jgi:hypothetical protein
MPPPKHPSFWRQHWQAIAVTVIGGVLIAVIGATLSGGASWIGEWLDKELEPDIPSAAIGSWEFVSFDGEEPPPILMATYRYNTLQLRRDGTYTVSGTLMFPDNQSMPFADSGDYHMQDSNTIRFFSQTADEEFQELDLKVVDDELHLIDPTVGVTHVFERA